MLPFFKSKQEPIEYPLVTDIHSHLLPGLDDGVKTLEESLTVISQLMALGYTRLFTTPHVMSDRYPNSSEIILSTLDTLKRYLAEKKVNITIDAAAEYYLDETLFLKIEQGERLLTISRNNYLLFETSFIAEPFSLKEFIFKATSAGYKLVMAHPERYVYMNLQKAEDLRNRGVLFQINLPSIVGYYSKPIQNLAHKLIDRGWVEFLGTDCHNMKQASVAQEAVASKYFNKAMALPLLNHSI